VSTPKVIVIAGAPGSGKSALLAALREHLDAPMIEFSTLREIHLDPQWRGQSSQEVVTDLREARVIDVVERFGSDVLVVTLFASEDVIRDRIADRTAGFTDASSAIAWNARVQAASPAASELRLDTSTTSAAVLASAVLSALST
jgi:predicted kinase